MGDTEREVHRPAEKYSVIDILSSPSSHVVSIVIEASIIIGSPSTSVPLIIRESKCPVELYSTTTPCFKFLKSALVRYKKIKNLLHNYFLMKTLHKEMKCGGVIFVA
jgi:hypothetical protein